MLQQQTGQHVLHQKNKHVYILIFVVKNNNTKACEDLTNKLLVKLAMLSFKIMFRYKDTSYLGLLKRY